MLKQCRATEKIRTLNSHDLRGFADRIHHPRHGVEGDRGQPALAEAGRVPGRFEPVEAGQDFTVLVDYAHNPAAVEGLMDLVRRMPARRLPCRSGAARGARADYARPRRSCAR